MLDVSSTDPALSAGVYWEVLPKKALTLEPRTHSGPRSANADARNVAPDVCKRVQDVDLLQTYPDVIRLGLAARPWGSHLERLDAEYATWLR